MPKRPETINGFRKRVFAGDGRERSGWTDFVMDDSNSRGMPYKGVRKTKE